MKKEGKRMYSYRVPERLYAEIDRMVKLRINEYERELLTGVKTESELFKPKKLAQQYNAKDYDLSDAWDQYKKANWYESESIDVEKVLWERFQIIQGNEKKSNPADDTLELVVNHKAPEWATKHKQVIKTETSKFEVKKIEPQVVEDKIEYEILESFPFGIEKIEDYGKNRSLYFCEPDYYTRVVNEKAKHISYESAVNYLKSK